jgi:uncharacterized cupin superfamily protein
MNCNDRLRPEFASLKAELFPSKPDCMRVIHGNPQARAAQVLYGPDCASSTFIWECTPGRFVWHYDWDETVVLLEVCVAIVQAANRNNGAEDLAFARSRQGEI